VHPRLLLYFRQFKTPCRQGKDILTVMSDLHQKLSRIEAFKINDQHGYSNKTLVFLQTYTDNIQEVCYTKVYKKFSMVELLHDFLYADPD